MSDGPKSVERLYPTKQLAEMLQLSPDTVRREFQRRPGVLRIGSGRRKLLRIPQSVLDQWQAEHAVTARPRG